MKKLEIMWVDSTGYDAWTQADSAKNATPEVCRSVGYKLNETKHLLYLSQTHSESHQVAGTLVIPKGCILKRRIVK